jgi:hypothetical protein
MVYTDDWYELREMRIHAVERGDMDTLRIMALRAGVFAALSIHNPVWRQERLYGEWLTGKPIDRGLPAHIGCVERVGAWIAAHMVRDLFLDLTGARFAESAETIKYLGPAKAHFFAACMGFDICPCIDIHMTRKLQAMGVMKTKFAPRRFPQYRALVEASGWTTLDQWKQFEDVPAQFPGKASFAETGHAVFFDSVLGRVG